MKLNLFADEHEIRIFNFIISRNIKKYRKVRKLSQESVSSSMGFSSPAFFGYAETNRLGKSFNMEHVYLISKILKVDIHNIIPNTQEIESAISNNSNKELLN